MGKKRVQYIATFRVVYALNKLGGSSVSARLRRCQAASEFISLVPCNQSWLLKIAANLRTHYALSL